MCLNETCSKVRIGKLSSHECRALVVAKRKAYRISVGKTELKRPLERARHRWVNNTKMDLM
jgi:hypothetical protein